MLARCANQTGGSDKYMAVVDTLFAKQNQWVVEKPLAPLEDIAKQFGFTTDSFKACLTNQKVLDGIEAVRDRAVEKLGVNSTPTFFINGKKIVGDVAIDTMAKEIDPYLKTG
jgi:protein-disulfide isomerase